MMSKTSVLFSLTMLSAISRKDLVAGSRDNEQYVSGELNALMSTKQRMYVYFRIHGSKPIHDRRSISHVIEISYNL
jgi:hypothetical protein